MKIADLLNSLQMHMSLYGYRPIETPIIESADLFVSRAGDQVINKLFTFERHGQQLALRPEFTTTAAYRYSQQALTGVARWQFSGPVFLDDPNGIQPNYQQLSMGAELIGLGGPAADAEIVSMAVGGIQAQNVQGWRLIIGHTGLIRQLLARYQLDSRTERFLLNHMNELRQPGLGKAHVLELFDQALLGPGPVSEDTAAITDADTLNLTEMNTQQILQGLLDATQRGMTMGGRTRHDIARRLLQKRQRLSERHQVVAALDFLDDYCSICDTAEPAFSVLSRLIPSDDATAQQLFEDWRGAIRLLSAYGIPADNLRVFPCLARNWDYYTGMIFELESEDGKDLGGGGRYDELVSLLGGETPVPAVGFAYDLDQLMRCTPNLPQAASRLAGIVSDQNNADAAAGLAHHLRGQGIAVALISGSTIEDSDHFEPIININANSDVRLNTSTFSKDQYDLLVTEIRRIQNGD